MAEMSKDVLEKPRQILDEENPDKMATLNYLVSTLKSQGKSSEAVEVSEILRKRHSLGEEDPETLIGLANVAVKLSNLGKYKEATEMAADVLKKMWHILGEEDTDTLALMSSLAAMYGNQGRVEEAAPMLAEVIEKKRRIFGEEHPSTIADMKNLAGLLVNQGKPGQAEPLLVDVFENRKRSLGEEHPDTIEALCSLTIALARQGKLEDEDLKMEEVLEKSRRILGEHHESTLSFMGDLGSRLANQGKIDKAVPLLTEVLEKNRRILGEEHPLTILCMNNLVTTLRKGKRDEILPLLAEALERKRGIFGEEHPNTVSAMRELAFMLAEQGRFDESILIQREALEKSRRVFGDEHPDTITNEINLAGMLGRHGKLQEAIPILSAAVKKMRRVVGEEMPETALVMGSLAAMLQDQEKYDEAAEVYKEVLEKRRRLLGEEHPDTFSTMKSLASSLNSQGKHDEAVPIQKDVLEKSRRLFGEKHATTISAKRELGSMFMSQGKPEESAETFREVLEEMRHSRGEEHTDTMLSLNHLGSALQMADRLDEAEGIYKEEVEKRRRVLGDEDPSTILAARNLAAVLKRQGKTDAAATAMDKDMVSGLEQMALSLISHGKLDQAEAILESVLQQRSATLGEDHLDTISTMSNLASVLARQEKHKMAEDMGKRLVEKRRHISGDEHPDTITALNNLAVTLNNQGKYHEAAEMAKDVLEKRQRLLGEEHPDTVLAMRGLATILKNKGASDEETIPIRRVVLEKSKRVFGDEHLDTMSATADLASALIGQSKLDEAVVVLEGLLEKNKNILGHEHPDTISTLKKLASARENQNRLDEAVAMLEDALEKQTRIFGENHPDTTQTITNLNIILAKQGKLQKLAAATKEIDEKNRRLRKHPPTLTSSYIESLSEDQGKIDEAVTIAKELQEKWDSILGTGERDDAAIMRMQVFAVRDQSTLEKVAATLDEVLEKRRRILDEKRSESASVVRMSADQSGTREFNSLPCSSCAELMPGSYLGALRCYGGKNNVTYPSCDRFLADLLEARCGFCCLVRSGLTKQVKTPLESHHPLTTVSYRYIWPEDLSSSQDGKSRVTCAAELRASTLLLEASMGEVKVWIHALAGQDQISAGVSDMMPKLQADIYNPLEFDCERYETASLCEWSMRRRRQELGVLLASLNAQHFMRGRPRGRTVDTGVLSRWIAQCDARRGSCTPTPLSGSIGCPIWMIDIGERKLVRIFADDGSSHRFAALSYVWGGKDVPQLMHRSENGVEARIKSPGGLGDHWDDIPLTIKDAMLLCERLSIPYLWVDALCLHQEQFIVDPSLPNQFDAMHKIYQAACVTMIAAAGEDSWAGLPGVRPESRQGTSATEHVDGTTFGLYEGPVHQLVAKTKWNTRAWTFQEVILSKRTLVFTDQEVFYECDCGFSWRESVLAENPHIPPTDFTIPSLKSSFKFSLNLDVGSKLDRQAESIPPRSAELAFFFSKVDIADAESSDGQAVAEGAGPSPKPYRLSISVGVDTGGDEDKSISPSDVYNRYVRLVRLYLRRRMTYPSDALRAFDAVVSYIRTATGHKFFKGLMEGLFYESLVFDVSRFHPRLRRAGFPSWSWCGWDFADEDTESNLALPNHDEMSWLSPKIFAYRLDPSSELEWARGDRKTSPPSFVVIEDKTRAAPRDKIPITDYRAEWSSQLGHMLVFSGECLQVDIPLEGALSEDDPEARKYHVLSPALGFESIELNQNWRMSQPEKLELVAVAETPGYDPDKREDSTGLRQVGWEDHAVPRVVAFLLETDEFGISRRAGVYKIEKSCWDSAPKTERWVYLC